MADDHEEARPGIAVLIPAFNAEAFIADALDSVAAQSRPADQIVVVDDGSTDDTSGRVRLWSERTGIEVLLIRQANRGPSAARNRAVEASECALLALLDPDDLLLPHHLETLEEGFRMRPHLALCFGNARRTLLDGDPHPFAPGTYQEGTPLEDLDYEPSGEGIRLLGDDVFTSLLRGSYIPTCATLASRQAVRGAGRWNEELRTAEDREYWLRLSRVGPFAYTPEVVACVRYHAESLSAQRTGPAWVADRLAALRGFLGGGSEPPLTARQLRATREALAETAGAYLYAASCEGLRPYIQAVLHLLRDGPRGPILAGRPVARAWASSLGLLTQNELNGRGVVPSRLR